MMKKQHTNLSSIRRNREKREAFDTDRSSHITPAIRKAITTLRKNLEKASLASKKSTLPRNDKDEASIEKQAHNAMTEDEPISRAELERLIEATY